MATWQVHEAKTRLSEVIEQAQTEGPQTITRDGAERAVAISIEDYRALAVYKSDFKAHLLGGTKVNDFTIERDATPAARSSFEHRGRLSPGHQLDLGDTQDPS
jgi:prevent-host-death family protein